jgi:hypothetical protein
LDFLIPFIRKLRRRNPARRPDASEALAGFQRLLSKMGKKGLEVPLTHCFLHNHSPSRRRRFALFIKGLRFG